jgi:hypothetical protein
MDAVASCPNCGRRFRVAGSNFAIFGMSHSDICNDSWGGSE